MEKLKHLSIKVAAAITMLLGILIATGLSALSIFLVDQQTNKISEKYEVDGDRYYLTDENGEKLGEGAVIFSATPNYSEEDEQKLRLFGFVRTGIVPFYFIISMVIVVFVFYRWKIQRPLLLLEEATDKISRQNLDFTIEYPVQDEMGKLVDSFEQMRKALYENNQYLWRTAEERKRVNATFAHDLRTPLTVLKGYNSFLLSNFRNPKLTEAKFESTSQLMEQQITRLEGFVNSMSSIQKIEQLTIHRKEITSDALIDSMKDILRVMDTEQKVILHVQLSEKHYNLDLMLILQVFENLIVNALRFAEDHVHIHVFVEEQRLYLKVEDDGAGFSKEALQNARAPFYRGGNEQTSTNFGLGLYMSDVLCQKHGGALLCENGEMGAVITASFKI